MGAWSACELSLASTEREACDSSDLEPSSSSSLVDPEGRLRMKRAAGCDRSKGANCDGVRLQTGVGEEELT